MGFSSELQIIEKSMGMYVGKMLREIVDYSSKLTMNLCM